MHQFIKELYDKHGNDAEIISNVGVKAKAFGTELFGHIDYIVIDSQGKMYMYLFKASTKPYYKWSDQKIKKYTYHAVFLK